ncbi:unnamed protein product [Enterobius vermicularis]|uniref:2Fe-2S ferredoxin-type domain-containing protein n=1 Tax=Enterobius vermicularis TaxID=51028 RepID=A0A0N4V0B2_ENTVE|nr:unnamed protein product [Enterobius vermicularis]
MKTHYLEICYSALFFTDGICEAASEANFTASKVLIKSNEGVHTAVANIGDTLLEVVENNDIPLDGFGACGGALACCSCHVILEKSHYERVPPPSEEELDLLDLSPALEEHSRLACQIVLTGEDDPEITVKVPSVIVDARTRD